MRTPRRSRTETRSGSEPHETCCGSRRTTPGSRAEADAGATGHDSANAADLEENGDRLISFLAAIFPFEVG